MPNGTAIALAAGVIASGITSGLTLAYPLIINKVIDKPYLTTAHHLALWRSSYNYGASTIPVAAIGSTLLLSFAGYVLKRSIYYYAAASSVAIIPFTLLCILPVNKLLFNMESEAMLGNEVDKDQAEQLIKKWNLLHLVRVLLSTTGFAIGVLATLQVL